MKNLFTLFIALWSISALGQSDTTPQKERLEETFSVAEPAQFPGGTDSLYWYIAQNLGYPQEAIDSNVFGKVWIQFTIDKQGFVKDVSVVRSDLKRYTYEQTEKKRRKKLEKVVPVEGYDYCLETCAANLISNSPKWKPATQRGKPVNMRFRLPINYNMQ
jgi:hypothetical protein